MAHDMYNIYSAEFGLKERIFNFIVLQDTIYNTLLYTSNAIFDKPGVLRQILN